MSEKTSPSPADALQGATDSRMEPLVRKIPKSVRPGHTFFIKGSTPSEAKRFTVNLQTSSDPDDGKSDIALHINFRFDYNGTDYVVCNTFEGSWGTEEVIREMPLSRGEKFEITIQCQEDHFKILVNMKHFTNYKYRMPLSTIKYLCILGDVIPIEVYIEQK